MADKGVLVCDGFEIQNVSATGFGAGGTTYSNSTNASVETSIIKNGAASLHCAPNGTTAGRLAWGLPAGNRVVVASFYVYVASLPASDLGIALTGGPTNFPGIVYKQASNKFAMRYGTGTSTAFGPTLSSATWYLIDWIMDVTSATFSQTAKVDGGTEVNLTKASETPADIVSISMGTTAGNPVADMYYDDLVVATSGYPLGTHVVKLLLPTGDGTHNAGTNVIENQAGTDITSPNAFPLVNEVPAENTDYIQQSASGSGNYAEITFADPSDATVWGVTAWAAVEGAAANGSGMIFRVVDSGGTTVVDQGTATGTVSGTTRRFSRALVPLVGGHSEWPTEPSGDLSGLKGRIGFSTDVVPVPRALLFALQYATPGDGLSVNLVVQDGAHAHAGDNIALTQVHELVVADASHAQAADTQALTQAHNITVADAADAHAADNVALTQVHNITVQDGAHSHTADNIVLTQIHELAVQDATHAHTADNLTVTPPGTIAVQDATHVQATDNIVLTQVHELAVQDATHGHTAESPTLTQSHILAVDDALHAHTADGIALSTGEEPTEPGLGGGIFLGPGFFAKERVHGRIRQEMPAFTQSLSAEVNDDELVLLLVL